MPEIHLKELRFTYSAWGAFTKNKERRQKFKESEDSIYIYKFSIMNAFTEAIYFTIHLTVI